MVLNLLCNAIFLVEHFYTASCLCSLLLACKERMALGADLNMDFRLCGTYCELITAVAGYLCFIVFWLYAFFHFFHLINFEKLLTLRMLLRQSVVFYHANTFQASGFLSFIDQMSLQDGSFLNRNTFRTRHY